MYLKCNTPVLASDRGVVRERKDTRRGEIDLPFAALTLLLLTTGVVMVLSASYARAYFSAATGHNAAYTSCASSASPRRARSPCSRSRRLPMGFYRRVSFPLLAVSVVLLALVPL